MLFESKTSGPAVFGASAAIAYVLLIAIANCYGGSPSRAEGDASNSSTSGNEGSASDAASHESQQERPCREDQSAMSHEQACVELGVQINSTIEEVKRAHREKAMQWHPDKLEDMAPELRGICHREDEADQPSIRTAHRRGSPCYLITSYRRNQYAGYA